MNEPERQSLGSPRGKSEQRMAWQSLTATVREDRESTTETYTANFY